MNAYAESRYTENIQRLALGLEPLDSERRTRIAHPIAVAFDDAPQGRARPSIERHDSCLHVLRFFESSDDRVEMNISDAAGKYATRRVGLPLPSSATIALRFDDPSRRFVPRHISFPVLKASEAEATPFTPGLRIRRPVLFPGAAYDANATATCLRGRVLRGDETPLRWARVEATIPGTNVVVGRAHGDDRGEFLLLLSPAASPLGDLEDPLPIRVTAFGLKDAPTPDDPTVPALDPLWDLPLELAAEAGQPDPVSAGETLPDDYISTSDSTRIVNFVLGKLQSGIEPFVIS